MFCPDCGLQNRDTAKFCIGCGVTLKELALGTALGGRYRLDARLGQGGMGVVYRAFDVRLECACALKELNATGQTAAERAESVARFKREAQMLRGLTHPGLPETQVRALALEVLDILAYLHAQNPPVIHRDVKPANIMQRAGTGQIALVDFGIARSHAGNTGTAIGTPEYCAPEQFAGRAVPGSDLYALGATMHHLLAGTVPTPFHFPEVGHVSPDLGRVVAKATALNAPDRYASAAEMRLALAGAGGGASPVAPKRRPGRPRTRTAPHVPAAPAPKAPSSRVPGSHQHRPVAPRLGGFDPRSGDQYRN